MNRAKIISSKLFNDWFARAPYETLSAEFAVESLDEAYAAQNAIQDMYVARRGSVSGRKIALTSLAMQEMCGIDQPIVGAIFRNDVLPSKAKIEARVFRHLGLEFELALELNQDVLPQADPHNTETVGELIAAARPAFEIIEDKGADYGQLDVFTLIADNAWCGGIVLGPVIDGWEAMDLGNIPSCVYQQGQPDQKTNTGAADPLGSLAWVLNHFSARGMTLSRGEHIITGSSIQTRFPTAGDKFSYDIAGAVVEVEIT
jgi:2-keto-4-pentenoate hydratase